MNRRSMSAIVISAGLLLSSCISTPRQKLPAVLHQAEQRNLAGVNAEAQGKLAVAESEFLEAYRLYSSVENFNGMVVTLINSSRVYREKGDIVQADAVINHAVNVSSHTPELEPEIFFEKARLFLSRALLDDAASSPQEPPVIRVIEEIASRQDVIFINLLPEFKARAEKGELLFYPFDTHWNSAGRQAADCVWRRAADQELLLC